ncbi:Phospholipase/carboxylesterase [Coniochaeta hoffmannii]|uniref:Phospholipase/carboxylesterase n=1 Tax=Coniochaeta hoffmannii TaxID=91930 RepID=A0AA38S6R3_9PEZI|nr:Phospholipase/carboxylesterase [Coniochaeta hoffmannii]
MTGETLVIGPASGHEHTHTIIFLHGRDSTNAEFASELFESEVLVGYRDAKEDQRTLPALLPTTRWVFPTAPMLKAERFGIDMSQWFDMWSVEDPGERAETQLEGLRQSVAAISETIRSEETLVPRRNIFLAGISQGFVTALTTFFVDGRGGFAGLIGLCSWMPCASLLDRMVPDIRNESAIRDSQAMYSGAPAQDPVSMVALRATPIFLAHAADDDVVPIGHGEQMRDVLSTKLRFDVSRHTYAEGGHWVNEPQGVEDMIDFITKHMALRESVEDLERAPNGGAV